MLIRFSVIVSFIYITILIGCHSNEEKSPQVYVPNVKTKCLTGGCFNDQFVGKSYNNKQVHYYSVILENVEVKTKPSYNSKVVFKFRPLDKVTILFKDRKIKKQGNNTGSWVFVKSDTNRKGWILDDSIGKRSMFKVDPEWGVKKFKFTYGDTNYTFRMIDSSRFTGKWESTYPADKGASGKEYGRLYRYKNILYLNSSRSELYDLFIEQGGQKNNFFFEIIE